MTIGLSNPRWWPMAIAPFAALLGLVAVLNPIIAIGGALALAFVAITIADMAVGIALFAFTSFTEDLPGVGAISAAKLFGGVIVLSWMAAAAASPGTREQLLRAHRGLIVMCGAMLAWVAAGLLWAESSGPVLEALSRYAPNMLLFGIFFAGLRNERDVRRVLIAFVIGVLLSTLYGAFIAPGDPDAAAEGRVTGAGVDPNELAAALVAGISLCAGVVLTRRYPGAARGLAGTFVLILAFCLVVTASRTGMIAFTGAAVFAIIFAGRGRRLPAAILAVTVLGLGAAYITQAAPEEARQRLQEFGTGSGRTDIWRVALKVAQTHPLNGVGSGNFPVVSKHYLFDAGNIQRVDFIIDSPKVVHELYLGLWTEIGIPGLLLFLAIIFTAIRCSARAANAFADGGNRPMELLSRSVVVATLGVLTAGLFISIEQERSLWILLALGPVLLRLGQASREEAAAA